MRSELQARHEALWREMIDQFERTAAVENHWLFYALLGWENLAACGVSHYLLEVKGWHDRRWPFVAVWLAQIFVAIATVKLVSGRPRTEESPLEPINKRIWTMFILLCINVAVLNVIAGQRVFLFMPALAVLSSFAFTVMTTVVSRRFIAAGIAMFVTGILMARFPAYAFLIYGAGWLAVLETLAVVFWQKRRRWLAA
jgi:hypothetical protein